MDTGRTFDYTPLSRRVGLGDRVRAAWANNLVVLAGTVGALLVIVPLVILVALVATGNATDVGGLAVLTMCFGAGIYVFVSILRESGGADAIERFARANDLILVRGTTVPYYAGSLFADGSCSVYGSVRTRDEAYVEVGDRFPTTAPRSRYRPNRRELFLRARLSGRAAPHDQALDQAPDQLDQAPQVVTRALDQELLRFAGDYRIEVSGPELTLFGSRELGVRDTTRVRTAFTLLDEIVEQVDATRLPDPGGPSSRPARTTSGIPIPVFREQGSPTARLPGPVRVIGWTLALMVVGPILIAVVLSLVDDHLRGNRLAARIVVAFIVGVVLLVVGRLARAAVTPRSTDDPGSEQH